MENNKQGKYKATLSIWYSFLFSIFIYSFIIYTIKPFPIKLKPYLDLLKGLNSMPIQGKILYVISLIEFFFILSSKNIMNKALKNKTQARFVILFGIAESIAFFGIVAAIILNNGIYYPIPALISIIALLYLFPKESEWEENQANNEPYSFE